MKKIILLSLTSLFLFSNASFAMNASLEPAVKMVETCLSEEAVLLCNDKIVNVLTHVSMDARGEFVYYLKDELNKNETPKVIVNLYEQLQVLVPEYAKLDTESDWSLRDLKVLLGTVSIRYVKISSVDSAFLISLYKSQPVQSARYGLLQTLLEKANGLKTLKEMDEMVRFAEVAKDYSRSIHDEYYLYQAAVEIIRVITLKELSLRPGFEGIYTIEFNDEAAKALKIDRVVVMESNDRDALVINFISSSSRIVKYSFKNAGVLGNKFFSNEDVYNEQPDFTNAFFKFDLNPATHEITGVFSTARYGQLKFSGVQSQSNISVLEQGNVSGLEISQLLGAHKVKVGNYSMTLKVNKRTEERTFFEGSLISDNAAISFSKVSFDSAKGVLTLVDSKNEKKLTLGITDFKSEAVFKGQFLNAPQGTVLEVNSL